MFGSPARIPRWSTLFFYFLGYLLGDGSVSAKKPTISMVSHSIDEMHFREFVVVPMIKKLFGVSPTVYKRKGKRAYGVMFDSRLVVTYLIQEIGFPWGQGPKRIPRMILQASRNMKKAFLRGFFDTDGTLIFSKKTYSNYEYPSIELKSVYREVIVGIAEILGQFGFRISIGRSVESWVIRINGVEMLMRWMKLVGTDNLKHRSKYAVWQRLGYCPPKTTVPQRLKIVREDGRVLFGKTNIG